jgi:hypothetical protein
MGQVDKGKDTRLPGEPERLQPKVTFPERERLNG